ncbi:helix-turn-helix domain-containing protein [Streptomyces smyrnaeus]|uniref:helix-turn-helix domain-containing protein n=1 Tax=Streptomyces smyrnaeus TaxID=1387713 RepID=UPI0036859E7D
MSAVRQPDPQCPASGGSVVPIQRGHLDGPARLLGSELRMLRDSRGLPQRAAAEAIRGSVAKVSRLERGETPPRRRDVQALLALYCVPEEKAAEIDALLRQVLDEAWYQRYLDVTPKFLHRLIRMEGQAREISVFENCVVPGILQTPDYARVLIKSAYPDAGTSDLDRMVALRKERLKQLRSCEKLQALIDAGVLLRPVGGNEIMRAQMEALLSLSREPFNKINIRIVPFEKTALLPVTHPIARLRFTDGGPPEQIYIERLHNAEYVTGKDEVLRYKKLFDRMREAALAREDSEKLLEKAIRDYS